MTAGGGSFVARRIGVVGIVLVGGGGGGIGRGFDDGSRVDNSRREHRIRAGGARGAGLGSKATAPGGVSAAASGVGGSIIQRVDNDDVPPTAAMMPDRVAAPDVTIPRRDVDTVPPTSAVLVLNIVAPLLSAASSDCGAAVAALDPPPPVLPHVFNGPAPTATIASFGRSTASSLRRFWVRTKVPLKMFLPAMKCYSRV
jgi:hypothetical protein